MPKDSGDMQNDSPKETPPADASAALPAAAGLDPRAQSTQLNPDPADVEGELGADIQPIEELTLSELLSNWLRAPRPTWRRLRSAMAAPSDSRPRVGLSPAPLALQSSAAVARESRALDALRSLPHTLRQADTIQLLLYGTAIVCALIGSVIARGSDDIPRANGYSLSVGGPYLWLGFLLWVSGEIAGNWAELKRYWQGLNRSARFRWAARALPFLIWINALLTLTASMTAPRESATALALTGVGWFIAGGLLWLVIEIVNWQAQRRLAPMGVAAPKILNRTSARRPVLTEISHLRKLLIALASLCSLLVWVNTSGNRIELPIILLWLISAALWGFVFAPLRWNLFDWASDRIDALRRIRWRAYRGTAIALALVMLLGAAFRLNMLDAYPPQLFSDLVEKIQDAYKIYHFDDYRIFLANIGGREPLHFYLLSILGTQPGMAFDHYALKLMSALESLITLPIVFWLGVEVMGKQRRRFGLLFGALVAGLVAVSFWHAVIGRQGLRISLAPLFSALTAIYLVRALRGNQRADYVKTGLALGFGLFGYQAARMLPLAAVAGVALTITLFRHSWRARLSYLLNLGVLAFVSLMVFLPMLHYWTEEPENYMRRASTRVFGDLPTAGEERAAFLADSVPVLMSNIRKTALIYHYYGDSAWVSGMGHEPAMDPVSAAFMLLGAAAWLALIVKTRDPAVWFVPVYLAATLLSTTLALSFPIEVPSFIRASGAIPPTYLIAALPVAVFCLRLCKKLSGRAGKVAAAMFVLVALLAANHYNTSLYFGEFSENFERASHPQAQAGKILRGFAESDGAYGNAFVLTSAHWWDIRAIGIEGGVMFWDSGGEANTAPLMIERGLRRAEPNRLDPERDLLFFYSLQNTEALALLSDWFPKGRQMLIDIEPAHKSFYIFRAPALGAERLQSFLEENR